MTNTTPAVIMAIRSATQFRRYCETLGSIAATMNGIAITSGTSAFMGK